MQYVEIVWPWTVHPGILKAAAEEAGSVPERLCVQLGWSDFVEAFCSMVIYWMISCLDFEIDCKLGFGSAEVC